MITNKICQTETVISIYVYDVYNIVNNELLEYILI